MQNKQSSFGDIHNLEIRIGGKLLTDSVATLIITQDLMSPVWSIQLEIIDTINNASKLKAGDKVSISLETKQGYDTDGRYKFDCFVHEIADRTQQSQNTVTLMLNCSTAGLMRNQEKRVKKAYKDKPQDKIVKDIVTEFLDGNVSDRPPSPQQHQPHTPFTQRDGTRQPSNADDTITWLAPNILPLDAISHMMKTARCNGKADYVFYTKDANSKTFGFDSLTKLFARKPVAKFVQRPTGLSDNGDYRQNKNLEFSVFVFDHFNSIGNASTGYNGNTVAIFDLLTKQWQASPNGKHSDSAWKVLPKHSQSVDGENILEKGKEWWSSRRQGLFKANQNRLKIQTFGHAKSFGWLGETCEIDIPSNNSMDASQKLDERYKGKYMIVAITHYITSQEYFNNIELANGWSK